MPERARLRGATLVAGLLFALGLLSTSFAVALGLWAAWNPRSLGASFWVPFALAAVVGLSAFTASRGCFVDVDDDELRDVVGWIPVQRIDRRHVTDVRVRLGAWRWFEVQLDDGSVRFLLGTAPAQFPMRLLPDADARDLGDLAVLGGRVDRDPTD
ncbi:MAG: hypothetical protein ACYC2O_02475 [Microthrixaceae bacterium]